MSRHELDRAVRSSTISLDVASRVKETFAVPGLDNALNALDECVADLLEEWGFSRERQAQLGRFPEPLKEEFVGPYDYPEDALKQGVSGENVAIARIDAEGRPSDCNVVASSKSDSLDRATCRAFLRARFKPATDKAGAPIESMYVLNLRWLQMSE